MKILLIGNCHSDTLHQTLNLLIGAARVARMDIPDFEREKPDLGKYDYVLIQDHIRLAELISSNRKDPRFIAFPNIIFSGYHPDMVLLRRKQPGGEPRRVSAIAQFAYFSGLSEEECVTLYTESFVSRLNYRAMFEAARRQFIEMLDGFGMCGHYYFGKWHLREPFMLNPGHPKLFVLADVARHLCRQMGLAPANIDPELFVVNRGRRGDIFPPYNHDRATDNSLVSANAIYTLVLKAHDIPAFVHHCYTIIAAEAEQLELPPARHEAFKKALQAHRQTALVRQPARSNPYADLSASHFWKSAVAEVSAADLAPVPAAVPVIEPAFRVATAGSCFAQHISGTLLAHGLNYHVSEPAPPGTSAGEAEQKSYGVFSARYGNIYTARQLLQLARRAYGEYVPQEDAWLDRSGQWIDPFRPNVGDAFDTPEALRTERTRHLTAVRAMLESLDVFVFTLGLTEAWMNAHDGAAYPVAPGVVSQHADYAAYRFHNFSHDEIRSDMVEFLGLLFRVNPGARVILTVSPVPLIATYAPEHVLSATTYSKSVLRSVAQELAGAFAPVHYFPSYEIITGAYSKGAYYDTDLRSVKPEGVAHVMRVFMSSQVVGAAQSFVPVVKTNDNVDAAALLEEIRENADIVCDEELITRN